MIQVKQLSKSFSKDHSWAVDHISFEIKKGELVCLIGPSGSGKTTVLKMINRLIEPTSGDIWVGGRNAKKQNPVHWRRKIGYVVQKAGLLPHLTVYENISLLSRVLGRPKKTIKKTVQELMNIINMPYEKFYNRYPYELSGGQQQRIGIARALMEDPGIILMDEPFSALDPLSSSELYQEFIQLNKKLNKTILFVSHDINEAFLLAHKIILMKKGKIEQIGTKEEFINSPKSPYAAEFISGYKRNNLHS